MTGPRETEPAAAPGSPDGAPLGAPDEDERRSLVEDIEDLVVDARTWFEAELSYQKTRASFVGNSLKNGIVAALAAAMLAALALVGLVVGLIIALTPLVTAWGATAIVVGVLLVACWLLLRRAASRWHDVMDAIHEGANEDGGE